MPKQKTHKASSKVLKKKKNGALDYKEYGGNHKTAKESSKQMRQRRNKRNFRKLWITRVNAACRENEISYSQFINGLNKAGIEINRKMLSEVAIDNPKYFTELVKIAKDALNGKMPKAAEVKAEKKVEKAEEVKEVKKTAAKKTTTAKSTEKKTATKTTAKKTTAKKEEK